MQQSLAIPKHVAIIMDGNGRWAQQRRQLRGFGHRAGGKSARMAVETAYRLGIQHLTLFAFSSENWSRPEDEVGLLMRLFMNALQQEVEELHKNGVRLRVVGDRERFSAALQQAMRDAETRTVGNDKLQLNLAVGYGGRWDIVQAARRLGRLVQQGVLQPEAINEADLAGKLSLADIPDPDLLIRTGGESRISNFLIWQMAYTELYFSDLLWPDFDEAAFREAVTWYGGRARRFGAVPVAPAET